MDKDNLLSRIWLLIVALAIVLALGFILFQLQNRQGTKRTFPSRRVEELAIMLKDAEEKKGSLEEEIVDLRKKVAAYEKGIPLEKKDLSSLVSELNALRMRTGFLATQGPGIIVRLEDSKRRLRQGEDPQQAIVHDEDILKVVNELWAAGAEAIEANRERVIAGTEIRCAGPIIFVNKTRLVSPYIIKAIGDALVLEGAMKLRGGYLEYLEMLGISINVVRARNIQISQYNGSTKSLYLKPVP